MKKLQSIIEYGLYLLAFLLPIQTRLILREGVLNGGYSEYSTISLYGIDILIASLVLLFFVFKIKELKNIRVKNFDKSWWILAGLEVVVLISIFQAIDKPVAIYRYLLFLLGVGLFWVLSKAVYDRSKLIYAFVAGAMLQAGLGVWQFFYQKTFAFKWLGMAEHLPSELGNSVIETFAGGRWLRAYGGMDHPNLFGGFLVVGLIIPLCHFVTSPLDRGENHNPSVPGGTSPLGKGRKLQFLILLVLFFGIFLSFSRAAWLALVVGLIIPLCLTASPLPTSPKATSGRGGKGRKLLIPISVLFVFGIILSSIFSELVFTRFSTEARLERKSYVERVESISVAKTVIRDNFFFGVGIGNYTQYVHKNINTDLKSWDYQPVHNVFLLVLAELGVLGLIIPLCLMASPLGKGRKSVCFGMMGVILVLFMFDHWFWSLHFGVILFWFILGVVGKRKSVVFVEK